MRRGGVDERCHFVMDHELWLRMGMAGFAVDYLPGPPLASFRICGGTKTFESAPKFHEEWLQVVLKVIDEPVFQRLPESERRKAVGSVKANLYTTRMLEAGDRGDRMRVLRSFAATIRSSPTLFLNAGLWRLAAGGVLGVRRDRLRKYRK